MIAVRPLPPPAVVVGRGRVGRALASSLGAGALPPTVVGGRQAAAEPETVVRGLREAGPACVLLLAVRDDALGGLASRFAAARPPIPPGTAVLHFSGALGVEVLAPLSDAGLPVGSCHPLQTFTGSPADPGRFEGATFAVEGEGEGRWAAERLALALGGRPVPVPPGARGLYHLAASLGANGLTGLVAASRDALVAAGFDPGEALEALGPLLRSALEEALRLGPEAALTGPVARGDEATIERHRRALLSWDAARGGLLEALLHEQRRLATRKRDGSGC
jgi:predicted short-subunit dehydrogenase-like oxidoreductase (DUF2520 family)